MEKKIEKISDIRKINSLFDNQVYANINDLLEYIENITDDWGKKIKKCDNLKTLREPHYRIKMLNDLYFKISELLI